MPGTIIMWKADGTIACRMIEMGQSTLPYIGVGAQLEFCRMAYIVLEPDAAISFRRAEVEEEE